MDKNTKILFLLIEIFLIIHYIYHWLRYKFKGGYSKFKYYFEHAINDFQGMLIFLVYLQILAVTGYYAFIALKEICEILNIFGYEI
jgi:hypothetical protein